MALYIYESCLGGFYYTSKEENIENLYCEQCGDYDTYLGKAENFCDVVDILRTHVTLFSVNDYTAEYCTKFFNKCCDVLGGSNVKYKIEEGRMALMIDLSESTIRDEAAQCLEDHFCGANCKNRKPAPNGGLGERQCENCEIWRLILKVITVSALKWRYLRGSYGEPTGWYQCPLCSHISKEMTNFCAYCGQKLEEIADEQE